MIKKKDFLKEYNIEKETLKKTGMKWEELNSIYDSYCRLEPQLKKIGKDLRPMFSDGNALELQRNWNNAMRSVINAIPGMPDIDINDDADSVQAAKNIVTKISNEGIYDRAGEYALQVNPEYKPEDYGE